jgi:hypothetical protein
MGHGFNAAGRMCPLPRSLAAEANGCFMVRTPNGPTDYKVAAQCFARHGGLPSVRSLPCTLMPRADTYVGIYGHIP